MTIDPTRALQQAGAMTTDDPASPDEAREAAREFESVLVRQFVSEMTKDIFSDSLAGEDGPGWMNSQKEQQRDQLTDMLTDHLVEAGAFKLDDLLLRQWKRAGLVKDPAEAATQPPTTQPPAAEQTQPQAPAGAVTATTASEAAMEAALEAVIGTAPDAP
jgi:Rod binding domain-containing protein